MKTVLVTGASKNIGRRIAEIFLKHGYHVVGTYNTASKDEITDLLKQHANLEMRSVDLANPEMLTGFIASLKSYEFDVIVNNAGMMNINNSGDIIHEFHEFKLSSFDAVMQCNFYAPLRLSLELKGSMRENGSIVNVASTDGMHATYASISYSASKAALINLTGSLANSYFSYKKIRVNCVAPGWIAADDIGGGMNTSPDSPAAKAGFLTPIGRNGKTTEVADVVFYLTSKESFFINGATIIVDGGFSNSDVIYYEEATGKTLLHTS